MSFSQDQGADAAASLLNDGKGSLFKRACKVAIMTVAICAGLTVVVASCTAWRANSLRGNEVADYPAGVPRDGVIGIDVPVNVTDCGIDNCSLTWELIVCGCISGDVYIDRVTGSINHGDPDRRTLGSVEDITGQQVRIISERQTSTGSPQLQGVGTGG